MSAGYSSMPLLKKLGIKPGFKVVLIGAPARYEQTLGELPADVRLMKRLGSDVDFIQFFVTRRSDLKARFPKLADALSRDGMIWISWPKGTAQVVTDLTRDVVCEIGLRIGLVDVKICAVDETWSALKFVRRLADR